MPRCKRQGITSTHRGHGHAIAKRRYGQDDGGMYGKSTGHRKAKGDRCILPHRNRYDRGKRNSRRRHSYCNRSGLSANQKTAGLPCFLAMEQAAGTLSRIHQHSFAFNLPVIYVCENNLWCRNQSSQMSGKLMT